MATLSEWLAGETTTGVQLDPAKVAKYRARHQSNATPSPTDQPRAPNPPKQQPQTLGDGVGTEVSRILKSIGISTDGCGGCEDMIRQMNAWGVDGCNANRATILLRLRSKAGKISWTAARKAEILAVASGLAWRVDWSDPSSSILDIAIAAVGEKNQPIP